MAPALKLLSNDLEHGQTLVLYAVTNTSPRRKSFYCVDKVTIIGYYDNNRQRLNYDAVVRISSCQ